MISWAFWAQKSLRSIPCAPLPAHQRPRLGVGDGLVVAALHRVPAE
ncbi:hypothetical protein ACFQV8_01860 [Pseudonocardia benzenivorans]